MADNMEVDSIQENNMENGEGSPTSDLSSRISELNVNAVEFVPSFANCNTNDTSPLNDGGTPPADVDVEEPPDKLSDRPLDSWEEAEQGSGTPGTPEDEEDGDDDMDDSSAEAERLKPKKKKKAPIQEPKVKKEHINIVFIGHVDAGKSTIGGQIMYLTGMVDKRTLEKYEREAKEKNRETWYLSWALDTNLEEREKGKTVEVGRAHFETDKKHFTILDAPGHRGFVPNMITGASQADLAVLVISARKGEFETGFEKGGQTREHAMLAKTAGVKHLIILINKMDDPTVEWSEERYNECRDKLTPYLRKCGFNPKTDLYYMPCSGLTGAFLKQVPDESICPWFRGPSFIDYIDEMPGIQRNIDGPFIMPIIDRFKDMGTLVLGKVESGQVKRGQSLLCLPNRTPVVVDQLWSDDKEVLSVVPGENVKMKLKGVEEEDISAGFVLCHPEMPCRVGKVFDAQVAILEHKSIICAGYSALCHIHACAEEVTVKRLLCLVDKRTGEKTQKFPRFVKQDNVAIMRLEASGVICLEPFKDFPQMGRFTLRDEGKTIAIGKVLKVVE